MDYFSTIPNRFVSQPTRLSPSIDLVQTLCPVQESIDRHCANRASDRCANKQKLVGQLSQAATARGSHSEKTTPAPNWFVPRQQLPTLHLPLGAECGAPKYPSSCICHSLTAPLYNTQNPPHHVIPIIRGLWHSLCPKCAEHLMGSRVDGWTLRVDPVWMVGFSTHHTDEFTTRAMRPRAVPRGSHCNWFTFLSPPQL